MMALGLPHSLHSCNIFLPQLSSDFSSPPCTQLHSRLLFKSCSTNNHINMNHIQRKAWKKRHFFLRCMNSDAEDSEAKNLTAEFMKYVTESQQLWPLDYRNPTALIPPTLVVKVQMEALMRNDWPEENSGIKTAFKFSMPEDVERILPGQSRPKTFSARAWDAEERYLTENDFQKIFQNSMYSPLLNCSNYEFISPLVFHGKEDMKALQAVKVLASKGDENDRYFTFTFCLEKVKTGAYKDCWMIIGTRLGDYANV